MSHDSNCLRISATDSAVMDTNNHVTARVCNIYICLTCFDDSIIFSLNL